MWSPVPATGRRENAVVVHRLTQKNTCLNTLLKSATAHFVKQKNISNLQNRKHDYAAVPHFKRKGAKPEPVVGSVGIGIGGESWDFSGA
jgi:hypothetical protein